MSVEKLEIPDVWVFTPKMFSDDRGLFFEWFQDSTYNEAAGSAFSLAQANCSHSSKGTLRGIHFADLPKGQRKYVTCISGSIFDVAVDLRRESETYGMWTSAVLSGENKKVISLPNGVGHGFMATEDAIVIYLCDQRYDPNNEYEINPLDLTLNINWPAGITPLLSPKDAAAPSFQDYMSSSLELFRKE